MEGVVVSGESVEGIEKGAHWESIDEPLTPHDISAERPRLFDPAEGDEELIPVVRDEHAAELGRGFEVDLVVGALGMGIDRAEYVPATIDQAGDDGPVDVGVGVERETTGH
jgi:hypothetical protein